MSAIGLTYPVHIIVKSGGSQSRRGCPIKTASQPLSKLRRRWPKHLVDFV